MEMNWMLIPLLAVITTAAMVVAVVAIVSWFRARDKELRYHQELRVQEMEHQARMKQLEIELEKTKQKTP